MADMDSIVFDATCLMRDHLTGIGNYSLQLMKALQKNGQDIQLSHKGHRISKSQKITDWTGLKSKAYIPLLSGLLYKNKGIFHGPDFKMIASNKWKRVVTVHDMAVYHPELLDQNFCEQGQRKLSAMLAQNPDAIITPTQFIADEVLKHFPKFKNRIHPIFHGSDHLQFTENKTSQKKQDYFLYVGTIEKRKNLETILQAFELFQNQQAQKKTPLVIVGGNGFGAQDILKQIEGFKFKSLIIKKGYIDNSELTELYQNATALLYPSLYEGFGIPLFEAMTLGCPVITSNYGAVHEVTNGCALKVQPESAEEISQAMAFAQKEDLKNLKQKAQERSKSFTWDLCAQKTMDVYKKILTT